MNAQWLQAVVIGVIVAVCLGMAIRRLLPGTSRRALTALAGFLARPGRSSVSRALARWLKPAAMAGGGCGSGGCSSCGGCSLANRAADEQQPLVFHPKPRTHS